MSIFIPPEVCEIVRKMVFTISGFNVHLTILDKYVRVDNVISENFTQTICPGHANPSRAGDKKNVRGDYGDYITVVLDRYHCARLVGVPDRAGLVRNIGIPSLGAPLKCVKSHSGHFEI